MPLPNHPAKLCECQLVLQLAPIADRMYSQAVLETTDLATIVALSTGVLQSVKGDLWILIQEHLELTGTDAQVILIEFVGYVPPYWTKLAPLLQRTCYRSGHSASQTVTGTLLLVA